MHHTPLCVCSTTQFLVFESLRRSQITPLRDPSSCALLYYFIMSNNTTNCQHEIAAIFFTVTVMSHVGIGGPPQVYNNIGQ